VVKLCSLLSENAQLNSECLEDSVKKYVVGNFSIKSTVVERCFVYRSDSEEFVDDDDYYRTDYMARVDWKPGNLRSMATEGLVEDYFGSWFPEDEDGEPYDPDKNVQIIFPFD
jgi:hypothetical protein